MNYLLSDAMNGVYFYFVNKSFYLGAIGTLNTVEVSFFVQYTSRGLDSFWQGDTQTLLIGD